MNDTVITLVKQEYSKNDFGAPIPVETSRDVFCSLKSVGRSDFYAAGQAGLALDHVFITDPVNYDGEQIIVYLGVRYEVTRTYQSSANTLEIYVGHKVGVFG